MESEPWFSKAGPLLGQFSCHQHLWSCFGTYARDAHTTNCAGWHAEGSAPSAPSSAAKAEQEATRSKLAVDVFVTELVHNAMWAATTEVAQEAEAAATTAVGALKTARCKRI